MKNVLDSKSNNTSSASLEANNPTIAINTPKSSKADVPDDDERSKLLAKTDSPEPKKRSNSKKRRSSSGKITYSK